MSLTYICIHCNKFVKDVDQKTAQKFLTIHNKVGWTGARTTRICVTQCITNEYLESKLSFNDKRHPNHRLTEEVV